jgi:hypothetical protein
MPDLATIWNLALGHVGEGTQVSDPDEATTVARVCRRSWDQARDAVLAEHPWLWARRLVTLAASATVPDPWPYAYVMPADVITILSVNPTWVDAWTTGTADYFWTDGAGAIYAGTLAATTMLAPVRWAIGGVTDEDGLETQVILSETTLGSVTYTRRVENTEIYPPIFTDAVSWRLAFEVCVPLSRSSEIRQLAWSVYQQRLGQAAVLDARQRRDRGMPDAESVLERG